MLELRIAKPCNQTWTAMKGDEQVRHCGSCRKNVYNISEMTEKEVEDLIRRTEGHFCARIYRRTDGRVLTADCPRGVAAVRRKRTLAVTGVFAAFAGILYGFPVMGETRSQAASHRSAVDDEPPMLGKAAVPEMALGEIAVPTPARHGKYEVQMGAPMIPKQTKTP